MKGDNNKNNDIIDAEFVSEGDAKIKTDQPGYSTESNESAQVTEYYDSKKEYHSEQSQTNYFKSFSYSFGNAAHLNFKKPSILKIILLIPFFLVVLLFFLMVGFIAFVIFLPKIFNVIRKKGISGLKMDYNLLKGLFGHFKMK